MMHFIINYILCCCCWLFLTGAHVPVFEPERLDKKGDFSFLDPLDITPYGNGTALVIESYLHDANDVDVFRYTKCDTSDELFFGFPAVSACNEYETVFPKLTLLYPMGDSYAYVSSSGGDGHAVGKNRVVFAFGNSSWLLPADYNSSCYENVEHEGSHCTFDYAIRLFSSQPGTYYWIISNDGGKAQDVTAIIGFRERLDLIQNAVRTLPASNKVHLHSVCSNLTSPHSTVTG